MDVSQALQALGLTDYEARAYRALLEHGELNGYALAKASSIPRPNIYTVIDKLVQRGAAERVDTVERPHYAAVAPQRLLAGIEAEQQQALGAARRALAQLPVGQQPAGVANLRGEELLAKARQLIHAARESLQVAVQASEAARLADALARAQERGVAITTLCLDACERECGGCCGEIHRYQLAPDSDANWLVLVAEQRTALIGQLDPAAGVAADEGVITDHPLVVELTTAYIRQSLTLATLGSEPTEHVAAMLSADTRTLLDRLYPGGDFPAYIQGLSGPVSS